MTADNHTITFVATRRPEEPPGLDLLVDGVPLRDLAEAFEVAQGYDAAGGYCLLYPEQVMARDLAAHLRGEDEDQYPEPGLTWVLMCECGEAGCWPLEARVTTTSTTVTWSDFRQPHRPLRRYDGLGPFVFDRAQLEAALAEGLRALAALPEPLS